MSETLTGENTVGVMVDLQIFRNMWLHKGNIFKVIYRWTWQRTCFTSCKISKAGTVGDMVIEVCQLNVGMPANTQNSQYPTEKKGNTAY